VGRRLEHRYRILCRGFRWMVGQQKGIIYSFELQRSYSDRLWHLCASRSLSCRSAEQECGRQRAVAAEVWPHDEDTWPDRYSGRPRTIVWIVSMTGGFLLSAAANASHVRDQRRAISLCIERGNDWLCFKWP